MFSFNNSKLVIQQCNRHLHSIRRYLHRDNSKSEQIVKLTRNLSQKYSEPNPEYHQASRSYVENYIKHHLSNKASEASLLHRNPRYRWIDFRRRMVYGTYDI
ncbi:hypothetical protein KR044_005484 [Drosophila immigrans]|nr:hypothetical protein KR044_005484 [Drosophila immigrans]